MDRQSWLKWRKIGSSDASIILGVSPWSTPYQLWMQKISGEERPDNPHMKRGREMEEEARHHLEMMTGYFLVPKNIESPDFEFMTASLDGFDEDTGMIAEIKCPGEKDHSMAKSGKIPEKYFPQLQHQMCCKGTEKMIYFSYYKDMEVCDPIIIHVCRDEQYIKKMVEAEAEFWERLRTQTPPNKMLKDESYEEPDEKLGELYCAFKEAAEKRKHYEEEEDRLKKEIVHTASGKNIKFTDGKLFQSLVKGSIQYEHVPELSGVNLDQYRKEPALRWTLRTS